MRKKVAERKLNLITLNTGVSLCITNLYREMVALVKMFNIKESISIKVCSINYN